MERLPTIQSPRAAEPWMGQFRRRILARDALTATCDDRSIEQNIGAPPVTGGPPSNGRRFRGRTPAKRARGSRSVRRWNRAWVHRFQVSTRTCMKSSWSTPGDAPNHPSTRSRDGWGCPRRGRCECVPRRTPTRASVMTRAHRPVRKETELDAAASPAPDQGPSPRDAAGLRRLEASDQSPAGSISAQAIVLMRIRPPLHGCQTCPFRSMPVRLAAILNAAPRTGMS